MRRRATALILILVSISFAFPAQAAEKAVGNACSSDTNATDWDTIVQCVSGTFVRANPFLAQTMGIGIGSTAPQTILDVGGGVTIGSTYAGVNTAPTSGLIVQGTVGIGTTSSGGALQVTSASTVNPTLILQGALSQTSNLLTFENYASAGYSSITSTGRFAAPAGTAGLPGFTFNANGNTGLYSPSSGNLAISANGLEYVRIGSTGLIGIGTTVPAATLDIAGAVYSRSISGSGTTISWASGNTQYTTASCGAFSFSGMQDGGSYTLVVEGATSGTCSFTNSDSPALTFKLPPNHGATTASTFTLYHFIRVGLYVIVTWIPGY